jgi:hypothetical protein
MFSASFITDALSVTLGLQGGIAGFAAVEHAVITHYARVGVSRHRAMRRHVQSFSAEAWSLGQQQDKFAWRQNYIENIPCDEACGIGREDHFTISSGLVF